MKNLAVIPARGGSKRIPKKNIKLFKNRPMIAWSIEVAKKSKCFDEILVSTDDQGIAAIAEEYGANVPFLRPKELSDDFTPTQSVIEHTIKWLYEKKISYENVCCIYPTAPFIKVDDLKNSLNILENSIEDIYVFVATSYPYPIFRSVFIDDEGYSKMIYPDKFKERSQDLQDAFHDTGQFYWAKSITWINKKNILQKAKPLVIPRWRVQDIDNEEDWIRAEIIYELLEKYKFISN